MPPRKRATTSTAKRPAKKAAAPKPAKRATAGRPPRLEIDPEIQTRIVDHVKAGAYPERAAVAVGVAERTHYLWQSKGLDEREHREAGKPARKTQQIYLDYVNALEQAVASAEITLLTKATNGGPAGTAALALLERRFRERWSPKQPPAGQPTKASAGGPAPATTPLDQLAQRRESRGG
jgi:hypothetical protein